jgi:hypothetical protein
MGADFKLDPSFEKKFLVSPAAEAEIQSKVAPLKKKAIDTAPDDPRTSGADLKTKIDVEVFVENGRVVGRLISRDWRSRFLHAGTRFIPANPWLRRAVESMGYKIERSPQG